MLDRTAGGMLAASEKITIDVLDMGCEACSEAVGRALSTSNAKALAATALLSALCGYAVALHTPTHTHLPHTDDASAKEDEEKEGQASHHASSLLPIASNRVHLGRNEPTLHNVRRPNGAQLLFPRC